MLDAATATVQLRRWLDEVANVRVHSTTGERPVARLWLLSRPWHRRGGATSRVLGRRRHTTRRPRARPVCGRTSKRDSRPSTCWPSMTHCCRRCNTRRRSAHEPAIQALCQTLSLPLTAQGYAAAAQQAATDQLAYSDFLEHVLRAEAAGRQSRKQSMLTRLAGFPALKTLEDFGYGFASGLKRSQIEELASLAFVERTENVVLVGPSGVGKTHPAIALGHAGRHQGTLHHRRRPAADAGPGA